MDIQKNRKEHMLKTDPAVFQDVLDGSKTFEIRFNDRGYQIGDLIVLKETKFTGQQMKSGQPLVYTGREIQKRISYVLGGYGLQDDWVILGIQDIEAAKAQAVPEKTVQLHLVWNENRDECVGFLDSKDARYTATGDDRGMFGVTALGDYFRDLNDERDEFETEVVMIEPQEPAND